MGGEREILSSGRKKFGRRRVALKWEPAEKNPYREGRSRVERCGEVARLPFLGCTGAKMIIGRHGNARPTSFRFFRDPCAFRRTPLTPKRRLAISLVFPIPPLSFSLVVRFLSFFGRGPNEWRSRNRVLFLLKIFRRAATCHPRSLH